VIDFVSNARVETYLKTEQVSELINQLLTVGDNVAMTTFMIEQQLTPIPTEVSITLKNDYECYDDTVKNRLRNSASCHTVLGFNDTVLFS